jgi:hypothetical protein
MHFPSFPLDEGYAACVACGKVAVITNSHIGVSIVTEDCEEGYVAAAGLLSTPTLVPLTEKVSVNPLHVVSVEFHAKDHMTSADDPRVIVVTTRGNHVLRDVALYEVVALINGSA